MSGSKKTKSSIKKKRPRKPRTLKELEESPTSMSRLDSEYVARICRHPILSREQERVLIGRFQRSKKKFVRDTAKNELIHHNIRLVVSIAKNYIWTQDFFCMADLVHIGVIGVQRALEKFDLRLGNKFSTYATWWIRQAIKRSVADYKRTIRQPSFFQDKFLKARKTLRKKLGRVPKPEELAECLEISVTEILVLLKEPLSYDRTDKRTDIKRSNVIAKNGTSLFGVVTNHEEIERLWNFLEQPCCNSKTDLTDLEKMILSDRFGLANGDSVSLKKISEYGGVTRERIRQLETSALNKLRVKFGLNLSRFKGRRRRKAS